MADLDVHTLFAVMLANVFAMSLAVPVVMGWRISPAARAVLGSTTAQALAWVSFLLARPVHDRLFSTLWIGLLGVSFALMWLSLDLWLGARPEPRRESRRPICLSHAGVADSASL